MTQYPSFDTDDPYGSGIDGSVTWQHALDFVKGMNNGTYPNCNAGFTNWRLPNIKELHSLGDYSGLSPALPPGWAGTYWSSTSFTYQYSLHTTYAYVANTDGVISYYDKLNSVLRVWPVRSDFGSDLSISKQDSPDPVAMGSSLTYTITVTNHGPAGRNSRESNRFSPGRGGLCFSRLIAGLLRSGPGTVTCTIGDMASDAVVTVTIVVNAPNVPGTIREYGHCFVARVKTPILQTTRQKKRHGLGEPSR